MIAKFVLIIIIGGQSNSPAVVIKQEFETRPKCEQVREHIVKDLSKTSNSYLSIRSQGCFRV